MNIAVTAIVVPLSPFHKLAGSLMAVAGNAVSFPDASSQEFDYVRFMSRSMTPRQISEETGLALRHVYRILSRDVDNTGGRPRVLSPEVKSLLIGLQQGGQMPWDISYSHALSGMGFDVSRQTVQQFFSSLGSRVIKIKPGEADKFTEENWLRLREFEIDMVGVQRKRLRMYDQTGWSFKESLSDKRRIIPGLPRPQAHSCPSTSASGHLSYFGITSIDVAKPAMYFKMYKKTKENSQNGDEHCDFLISAAKDNLFTPGDIIICDNWAPHVGRRGVKLEEYLWTYYGVILYPLPSRFSHLNSVEHCWARGKAYARAATAYMGTDSSWTDAIFSYGLQSITHADIMADMMHDGYGIEESTMNEVKQYSRRTPPLRELMRSWA